MNRLLLPLCLLIGAGAGAWISHAQGPVPAQIGMTAPLPVYVTNGSSERLPEGFVQGTRWRFTTWTMPSVISWSASVNRTTGAWANLTVTPDNGPSTTRWYYIPAMPGSWERQ
jgi:hypothetical protein